MVFKASKFNTVDFFGRSSGENLFKEELKWTQRSGNQWLAEGDRDAKFLHGVASARH